MSKEAIAGYVFLVTILVLLPIFILRELLGYNRLWRLNLDYKMEMWKLKRAEKKRLKKLEKEAQETLNNISVRVSYKNDQGDSVIVYDSDRDSIQSDDEEEGFEPLLWKYRRLKRERKMRELQEKRMRRNLNS